jgi:hypothetical protein
VRRSHEARAHGTCNPQVIEDGRKRSLLEQYFQIGRQFEDEVIGDAPLDEWGRKDRVKLQGSHVVRDLVDDLRLADAACSPDVERHTFADQRMERPKSFDGFMGSSLEGGLLLTTRMTAIHFGGRGWMEIRSGRTGALDAWTEDTASQRRGLGPDARTGLRAGRM